VRVVIEEEDGVREMRRRKVRAAEEQGGPEMYGAGPFFVFWRMRRGTKQKVDRATTATPAALRCGQKCKSPRLDCDCLAGPDGSRTIAL
jgi:hypothetical protein